jgi:Fe-S oxidoreductase
LILYEIAGERDVRGLGTGNLPEVDLRVHTFSDEGSMAEAQEINRQIVTLLKDAVVSVTGFNQCGRIVYHETLMFPAEELHGVKVTEVVSLYTVWIEA